MYTMLWYVSPSTNILTADIPTKVPYVIWCSSWFYRKTGWFNEGCNETIIKNHDPLNPKTTVSWQSNERIDYNFRKNVEIFNTIPVNMFLALTGFWLLILSTFFDILGKWLILYLPQIVCHVVHPIASLHPKGLALVHMKGCRLMWSKEVWRSGQILVVQGLKRENYIHLDKKRSQYKPFF